MAIADTPKLRAVEHADVVVVGAGPGGSAAAAHLAARGRDVIVLEKDTFPRDKVCGDGLTPRVIRELLDLGLEDEAHGRAPGFKRNKGLRINGGHTTMELPWPELEDWPNWGGCSTRMVFDETIARTAVQRGATLAQGHAVTRPLWRDQSQSRVTGVAWKDREGRQGEVRAPVVIAADGAGGPMAKHLGVQRRQERPMAVAARGYYRSPRADDEWISSYLDLTDAGGNLLSGYGWVFPLDDGTMNVGLGLLSTSREFQAVNYRRLLESWATGMAADGWGTTPAALEGPIRTGPIPMGFNHTPLHQRGVLLVGDSGGMVNPFNGEGISYAMEAAQLAAEVVDGALVTRRTSDLDRYDRELRQRIGGYYTLGRVFAELVGNPTVMHVCTTYGMPYRPLMLLVLKLMAHLTDRHPVDTKDVIVNTLQRLAPAA
ncbi:MAG: geranylgeranyl reductase family protein [Nitriliruptoraceae bacterium]